MSLAIFAVGVFVFLITVYGTVVVGGLFLTDRQLEDQPALAPDVVGDADDVDVTDDSATRVRRLVAADF